MQKFKVGDRVRVREWDDMAKEFGTINGDLALGGGACFIKEMRYLCGQTGTVVQAKPEGCLDQILTIDWDNSEESLDWILDNTMFELIDNSKIVITTDGKTTTAKLYKDKLLCETAIAKCSPKDKFDFNVGAKLAMDRLMEIMEYDKDNANTKSDKNAIGVGDRVRIKRNVYDIDIYDMYDSWITKYAPEYAIYYAYGADLREEEFGNDCFVLKKAEHDLMHNRMLCLISTSPNPIDDCTPCYLIAEKCLKKTSQQEQEPVSLYA